MKKKRKKRKSQFIDLRWMKIQNFAICWIERYNAIKKNKKKLMQSLNEMFFEILYEPTMIESLKAGWEQLNMIFKRDAECLQFITDWSK